MFEAISNDQTANNNTGIFNQKYPLLKIGINNDGKLYTYYPINIPTVNSYSQLSYHFDAGDSMQTALPIKNNSWYHLALVKKYNIVRLYLNGSLINTKNNANINYDYNTTFVRFNPFNFS